MRSLYSQGMCWNKCLLAMETPKIFRGPVLLFLLLFSSGYLRRAYLVTGNSSVASGQGGGREGRGEDVQLHDSCDVEEFSGGARYCSTGIYFRSTLA